MTKSRLVLGTAQLGMRYGLRIAFRPSEEEAFAILDEAYGGGINTFDTAASYGEAEEILGEWIKTRKLADQVFVVTKLRSGVDASQISEELRNSLARLQLKRVEGYLLHDPRLLYKDNVIEALLNVKETGLAEYVGVSIYDTEDALAAAESTLDYIQVPFNVLDQRLRRTEFFSLARKSGKRVFSRSALLQGLLTMDIGSIPSHLSAARPFLEKFSTIAKKAGRLSLTAAFQYSYVRSPADHIVFGVDSREQLRELIKLANDARDEPWMSKIEENFADVPCEIVDPRLWKKL